MFHIYKKLSWFIKEEKISYITLFFLLNLITIQYLVPAYFLGLSIDIIVSGTLNVKTLSFLVITLISIPLLRYLSSYIYNYKISKLSQKLSFKLRENYLNPF